MRRGGGLRTIRTEPLGAKVATGASVRQYGSDASRSWKCQSVLCDHGPSADGAQDSVSARCAHGKLALRRSEHFVVGMSGMDGPGAVTPKISTVLSGARSARASWAKRGSTTSAIEYGPSAEPLSETSRTSREFVK